MDSVNKYGSDGVPFTGEIAEPGTIEQQIHDALVSILQALDAAFVLVAQSFNDALVSILQALDAALASSTQALVDEIKITLEAALKSYPDKRIVHLAFHGKTARIRKKNRSRIAKYIKKELKRSG